jgi:Flp pilus assembly protein TadG
MMICNQEKVKFPIGRRRRQVAGRRGVAMIETALILTSLFIVTVGLLDFAIGIYRYHILSEAARQLARNAIVHGQYADRLGTWGPSTFSGVASSGNIMATTVKPYLVGLDPTTVSVKVEWPEASNQVEKSVRTTLTTAFHPLFTSWFGSSITLRAQSEMKIAH